MFQGGHSLSLLSIIRQKVSPERLTFLTCTRYKPSSVPPMEASIIYLRLWSPIASSNLPPDIGRAALNCRYTRSCNPRDAQPRRIATLAVGSYPAFSPLPLRAVIFFYANLPSLIASTFRNTVSCIARTFLSQYTLPATNRRTVFIWVRRYGISLFPQRIYLKIKHSTCYLCNSLLYLRFILPELAS